MEGHHTIPTHQELCKKCSDLKPELEILNDFELEIKFKPDLEKMFSKPPTVSFGIQVNLNLAYMAGINVFGKVLQFMEHQNST